MVNDLIRIKNDMGMPGGQERFSREDPQEGYDEVLDDQSEWLGISAKYSPYHAGYTTNHWLMVFRAVEATA